MHSSKRPRTIKRSVVEDDTSQTMVKVQATLAVAAKAAKVARAAERENGRARAKERVAG